MLLSCDLSNLVNQEYKLSRVTHRIRNYGPADGVQQFLNFEVNIHFLIVKNSFSFLLQ